MSDIDGRLREAEIAAERLSAALRAVVFVTLAGAVALAVDERGGDGGEIAAVAIYGAGAAAGLLLAWRGVHHPLIPWAFVTFDVALVSVQILALAQLMGMGAGGVFALPATGLVFVILIHAAMRYQPWLVAYAAILFIVIIEAGARLFVDAGPAPGGMMAGAESPHAGMSGAVNFEIVPVVLIALAAVILVATVMRTRRLLLHAVRQAARSARLSRYFSPSLAARLADGDENELLAGRRQKAAVLFVDLRDFTAMGETMAPEELGAFLSEYRTRLVRPVLDNGGAVDKFIGDAIMAVFGAASPGPQDAAAAVRCALGVVEEARRWSAERVAAGEAPVAIGVGGDFGEVFAGALGAGELLEYTVIGDTVNVAERLERLSREVGSPIVLSAKLLEAAGEAAKAARWERLPPQRLKGHVRPVRAFRLAREDEAGDEIGETA